MDRYVTAGTIRRLRREKHLTQAQLAEKIGVSPKTVSKWETDKGLPDVSLLSPLAAALGVSLAELLCGAAVHNRNRAANLLRSEFYVCPLCGNVIHAMGSAVISCCGIPLSPLPAEEADADHEITIQAVEDEQFLTVRHEMTKEHYISFLAYVTTDKLRLVKLYPEGNAECRFSLRGPGYLYLYCSRHGLMRQKL